MFEWKTKATNAIILNEDAGGKGRLFRARFLQAGLVKYSFGVCLLKKETIDKFINSFVGCPVVIDHKDVSDENAKEMRVGVISKVDFDPMDAWYWCEGVLFDQEAINLVKDGYNVSCQYAITEYATNETGELHNGNQYDKEILNGSFEHLAIVNNPRYEGAFIAVNSQEENIEENIEKESKTLEEVAQNTMSFEEQFKETLYNAIAEGIVNRLGELIAQNYNHNHGKDGKFCSSGVTGQDAIKQMIKQKKGTIKNAFYRKDIGHIDLIWGDGSKGLSHILKRRGKDERQNIDEFIADLDVVIQNGKKSENLNKDGRWEITLNGKMAIIEPKETNGKRTFLLSAFKSRSA